MIHRIMRAPEKRVFKIDIGNIPPNEVDNFMEKIKLLKPGITGIGSIIFRDEESEVDDRGYTHFQYDDAVANISYGFGHSYRNEVTIWGEKAILKTNRVFTRPKNCDVPIQLWNNGKYERYEVENVDHFLGMINSFSDSISNNNDLNK